MKIRVLSDLHIDVNEMYAYHRVTHLKDNDVFTIVAGDTAGCPELAADWIQKNVQKGLVIAGNHIVYSSNYRPIQDLKKQMAQTFPKDAPITFLDHMTGTMAKEVDNILFIGTTLYTNYTLLPNVSAKDAMYYANSRHGLNDFYCGYTRDHGKVRHINPKDYQRWFIESYKEMTRLIQSHPDKDVVVITHHCPSRRCCRDGYDLLHTSYASDLEPFILKHPNIKLWVCGHVHERKNFKVGNCLVLMNPQGYAHEGESFNFNPHTFVDTRDWSVHQESNLNNLGKQMEIQDKALFQNMLKRACFEL